MGKVLSTPILETLDYLILMKNNSYLGLEVLAIELNISVNTLRRWLNNYRSEGFTKFLEKRVMYVLIRLLSLKLMKD